MAILFFRCPIREIHTHVWVADEVPARPSDEYVTITCIACLEVHLINPSTSKVVGSREDPKTPRA